ncbi:MULTISPECIES: MEKHLA domain-containing protein [Arthrospira]|jgi:hypothetical protein|uniref:MEKHLA domain-containing protein n=1 Tax=Limnospira platensis NIES-46 TaxID=1236695 RepID=A0A5M3TC31_LIMPL|nr:MULTISPECIES: MEKHLA domain-containing protein [Arthrospira]AMW30188.1 MEKHLA domain-containing protein [Arthrospira platensis YZ]KDR58985.1 hypothetical protein APPUASWS_001820 [Arthrospira platensis str. Paraca]MBD2671286.1 MEKHLA domain-containing protein [Arthrospira platensis FACHB-439]MBD2712413.1 MEKHLA domain-containing protein [Arthrospira platensis FACHB-835]MDF2207911.1 MEKHLA domain-containing protein [Arthrospira platensis NCB002]MDT9185422.1 MEKHLA domain-containing protein [
MNNHPIWQQESVILNNQLMIRSFEYWTGKQLINTQGTPEQISKALFELPFPVLCHDTQPDPIFNYGNQKAMELWEVTWEELTQMPSRYSAEAIVREDRLKLLKTVAENGYIENGTGVRISKTGRRFAISNLTVWNVLDNHNNYCGQAATYKTWQYLD